jgi:Uma2 family endonuclease
VTDVWDGTMLTRPQETPRHQMIVGALAGALRAGRRDLHVLSGVPVRLGPQRIVMPDLVVTGEIDPDAPVVEAGSVLMVAEVTSPATAAVDRTLKMRGYADAGIPWYLLVEQDTQSMHGHALVEGSYVERSTLQLESIL